MRLSRHTTALTSAVLALVVACAACSSSPDIGTVRQQYLTIVKNTDKALTRDRTVKHLAQTLARYSVDFHNAAVQFRAVQFPTTLQHDAQALIAALDTLSTDAAKTATAAAKPQTVQANVVAMANLNLKLMEEEKTEQTVSNALRQALGLPPPTTTTTAPSSLTPTPLTPTPTVPVTTAAG